MVLTWIQTLVLALLQGVTELFPISSLGHTVIIPGLLGWTALVQSPTFLPIVVAFHLGTSIALILYFWQDWLKVGKTLVKSVKDGEVKQGEESWISWLIIIGSIPAGLLGVALENPLKQLFATPLIAASFLVVNGSLLFLGEALRRRAMQNSAPAYAGAMNQASVVPQAWESTASAGSAGGVAVKSRTAAPLAFAPSSGTSRPLLSLSWKDALLVGFAQSLALLPGISRSGATMVAGLSVGLSNEDAAHFAFLLGTPLIAAAALLEVPQLSGVSGATIILVIVGMVLSGLAAYFSTKFLMRYFETGKLNPFAYYCWAMGGISLILFFLGVGVH